VPENAFMEQERWRWCHPSLVSRRTSV